MQKLGAGLSLQDAVDMILAAIAVPGTTSWLSKALTSITTP